MRQMESHTSLLISADSLFTLTLEQIAWTCSVEPAWIQVLVDDAILSPSGVTAADWRFSAEDLTRARRAWRLYHELEANPEVLGLILDMQDEINRLHRRLDCA